MKKYKVKKIQLEGWKRDGEVDLQCEQLRFEQEKFNADRKLNMERLVLERKKMVHEEKMVLFRSTAS